MFKILLLGCFALVTQSIAFADKDSAGLTKFGCMVQCGKSKTTLTTDDLKPSQENEEAVKHTVENSECAGKYEVSIKRTTPVSSHSEKKVSIYKIEADGKKFKNGVVFKQEPNSDQMYFSENNFHVVCKNDDSDDTTDERQYACKYKCGDATVAFTLLRSMHQYDKSHGSLDRPQIMRGIGGKTLQGCESYYELGFHKSEDPSLPPVIAVFQTPQKGKKEKKILQHINVSSDGTNRLQFSKNDFALECQALPARDFEGFMREPIIRVKSGPDQGLKKAASKKNFKPKAKGAKAI